jgi:histidinol-phosphate phosphatase family protein
VKQLVILAGGKGTRLRERLGDLPKSMIPIGGKPLLEHQIELARKHAFTDIVIFAGYRADAIQNHFGQGDKLGVQLRYEIESEPLGTAGAVLAGLESLAEHFAVIYGDVMVNVDLERIWRKHLASGADATLLLHPNDHPFDSDLVEIDQTGWITAFHNRPHPAEAYFQNLVNAGLYVLTREALRPWRRKEEATGENREGREISQIANHKSQITNPLLDFGKDLFPAMLRSGAKLLGYNSPEYIKDIGTPARYDRISAEYAAGLVQRSSLATQQRAVFVDRDGTLNKEVDGVTSVEKLELLPGVAEGIHLLNHKGFRVVVISNQPVIAKGFCSEADLRLVHNKLESLLGREHAFLDRIYFCPHHPEKGFPGERAELKIECTCRKPHPGLVRRAAEDLNIDLGQSWFIGDTTTDIQTARNAGVRSILVRTGYAGKDAKFNVQPDHVFASFKEAAEFVVNHE